MKTMRVVIFNEYNCENVETLVNSKEALIELLEVMPEYCELVKVEPMNQYQNLNEVMNYFKELQAMPVPESVIDNEDGDYKIQF